MDIAALIPMLTALGVYPPKAAEKYAGAVLELQAPVVVGTVDYVLDTMIPVRDTLGGAITGTVGRITVPPGYSFARLRGQVLGASASGQCNAKIYKNGSRAVHSTNTDIDSAGADYCPVFTAAIPVVPGDYFQLAVVSAAGRTIDVGANDTWLDIELFN